MKTMEIYSSMASGPTGPTQMRMCKNGYGWEILPLKVLAQQECEKKKKYLTACLEQRKHFTPFVISTDGLLDHEVLKGLGS
jgi:hypothetical protein